MLASLCKKCINEISVRPVEVFAGICIFLVAIFGASVHSVASTVLALLFIASLFYIRSWGLAWESLSRYESWVLIGFVLFTISGLLSYWNTSDEHDYIRQIGRYIRFTLIVPVYLLIVKHEIRVYKYFLAGVFFSGPVFLAIALISIQQGVAVSGQYNRILFGDIAVLNMLIMSVYILAGKDTGLMRAFFIFSMLCAGYAALLSEARTSWVALFLCVPLLIYALKKNRIKLKTAIFVFILISAAFVVSPAKDIVVNRINIAIDQVERYVDGNKIELYANGTMKKTGSASRLALWHVAINVWREHPIIGTGLGDFDEDFQVSQEQGLYEYFYAHDNVHSIYFQGLATTGSVGFIVLIFALFVLPYKLFLEIKRTGSEIVGLSGMVFIVSFAIFGLTESWTLRAPFMSMYLAYFVALMSSAPRPGIFDKDGQNSALNQSAIDEKSLPT